MNELLDKIPDELFDHLRPQVRPLKDRIRFSATKESIEFLAECESQGYDISTIINLSLHCFKPKTKPDGYTWKGIKSVCEH